MSVEIISLSNINLLVKLDQPGSKILGLPLCLIENFDQHIQY